MNTYSYSKIKTWNECPLSYKLTYLDKVGRDEGDALTLGSAAHEFFEDYVTKCKLALDYGIQWKDGCYTAIVPPSFDWDKAALLVWSKEARDQSLYEQYLNICKSFMKNFDPKDIPEGSKTLCEVALGLTEDGLPCDFMADNVFLRAKIDRLDLNGSTAKITDYKTGFGGKADAFQCNIYAYMVSKHYPEIQNFEVVIHYVRTNWKESWKFSKDKLSGIEFQLKAITETIEKDTKFKAKPGSRCSSCMVAFACDRKASNIKVIEKPKNAQKVAEDILALDAQIDAKKEMLKSWVQENGEVIVNGEKFSFFPLETMKSDTKELASCLMSNNVEPWNYLKGDTKEIKKLCRENPQIADSLSQALTFNVSLRFSHKSNE